jgi:uncharacterized protein YgiM (DUF1202 family)
MEQSRRHPGEHFITVAVVLLLSASVSYAEVARPTLQQVAGYLPFAQSKPKSQTKPAQGSAQPTKTQATPATPATATVATPVPTTPPVPAAKMATTNSFAHIRAGKGTDTAIIANVDAGTSLELRDDSDSTWQGIIYQGQPAYIYKQYLNY